MKILSSQQGVERLKIALDQEIQEQNIAQTEIVRVESGAMKLAYNLDQNTESTELNLDLQFENKFSKEIIREIISLSKNIYLEASPEEFNNMCQQLANNFSFNRNFLENSPYSQKLGLLTMMHYEKAKKQKFFGEEVLMEKQQEADFQTYISQEMLANGVISLKQASETISEQDLSDPDFKKKLILAGVIMFTKQPRASFREKIAVDDGKPFSGQNISNSFPQDAKRGSAEKYQAGSESGKKIGTEMDDYRLTLAKQYMTAQGIEQKNRIKATKRRNMLIKIAAGGAFGGISALIGSVALEGTGSSPESINPSGLAIFLHHFSDIITGFC